MSLAQRQKRFQEMSSRFVCERPNPLIAVAKINPDLFYKLRFAVLAYLSKSLPQRKLILDENELLIAFQTARDKIKNCTPNGMIVPKQHLILEFNSIVMTFIEIIDSLNIADFIESWHIPLMIRYKDALPVEANLRRPNPTEHVHSDAWVGESSGGVNVIIPLFGDTDRNKVVYFRPPDHFTEDWLKPLSKFADGQEITNQYSELDIPFSKGNIYLADFAVLHRTTRRPDAHERISLDVTFEMNKALGEEYRHSWNLSERAQHQDLRKIGSKKIFVFFDEEDQVTQRDGLRTTNFQIVDLIA